MPFDWPLLNWIQQHMQSSFCDTFFSHITVFGNAGAIWILIGLTLLCFKKYRREGIVLLAGLALGWLTGNLILKNLIARPRPFQADSTITLLIAAPSGYSFPSGHALSSCIGACLLATFDKRFGYAAIPLALVIAFSRLYLQVHYPSDVLTGILLGMLLAFLTTLAANKVCPKRKMTVG